MRKRGMLFLFTVGFLGSSVIGIGSARVAAAACANVSSFGAVSLSAPELSNIQEQSIWVRMQGETGSRLLVEVNEAECYEITLQEDSTDNWTWKTLQDGNQVRKVPFPSPTGNKIRLIGVSGGVRIDRVLIAEPDCVPEDYGNNCQSSVSLKNTNQEERTALPSPSGTVSGVVHLSPTVQDDSGQIDLLTYSVNGRVIQDEQTGEPFDTTLLENGRYTVYITSTMTDGTIVREMVVIDIENPENALTPVVRWAKQNIASLQMVGIILLSVATGYVIFKFVAGTRRKRRERTFRGLE